MAVPMRLPNGVTNVDATDPLAQLGMLDPTKFHTYFNDFDVFTAGDWTITALDGGADSGEVHAVQDADGGILLVTTNDADNDNVCLESQGEAWKLETGKKAWLKIRLKVEDADDSDFYFGWHTTDTNPFSTAPTQRAYFALTEGAATVTFDMDDNSTDAESDTVATLSDDTYVVLAMYYDGKGNIELYADGVKITTMTSVSIPSTEMALGFGVATGAAATRSLHVDYILAVKER